MYFEIACVYESKSRGSINTNFIINTYSYYSKTTKDATNELWIAKPSKISDYINSKYISCYLS